MDLYQLVFGVYPYVALTVFIVGSWIRFDTEQYTWKSDSSQLLSRDGMMLASNLFHIGVIAIFLGHLVGLLMPHAVFQALGVSDMTHQWVAIAAGSVATTMLAGRTVAQALALTDAQIAAALGGLPDDRRECSVLAPRAVRAALGSR